MKRRRELGALKGLEKGGGGTGAVSQGRMGGRWCPVKLAHRNSSHTSGHLGLGRRGWESLWEVTVPELGMLAVSSDIPRPPLPCGKDRWMPKRLFMTCVPRHGDLRGSEL